MFVGRDNELAALEKWVKDDKTRAGVLVGSVGRGKSALLKAFEDQCAGRDIAELPWYVQSLAVTGDQQASQAMEHLLGMMYSAYSGFVKTGPGDRDLWRASLLSIPAAGKLLAALVKQDTRPGWQRFLHFAAELSKAAVNEYGGDTRLIFLIDPQHELQLAKPGDWVPLAEGLPDAVRLIIAQRPDDTLVTHGDARRAFSSILEPPLGDLSENEVAQWYEQEIDAGQLQDFDASVHGTLWRTAYERYSGYPFAHDAVIKVLAYDKPAPAALQEAIIQMPQDVHDLLDLLYQKLCALGNDQHRAALTLCVFALPAPQEVWAKASKMDPVAFTRMLADDRFACLFRRVETRFGKCFLPYHQLFAERLERELKNDAVRNDIAEAAWSAIAPPLSDEALKSCNAPFFELTVAVSVAACSSEPVRLFEIIDATVALKIRLGLLDDAASDMHLLLAYFGSDEEIAAIACNNLGLVMKIRGDLDGAEEMHCKALKINKKLGRLEGMAGAYGNLGLVMESRGDLNGAEEMHRKALAINEDLGRLEGMADNYGNLGIIMKTRGNLDDAEAMHRKSLEINEKLGRLEGMATNYGNLGIIMEKRGDLEKARAMWVKARDLFAKLGAQQQVIQVQGWIDGLSS